MPKHPSKYPQRESFKDNVVVTGYAIVPPISFLNATEGLTPGFGSSVQPLSRRVDRFACRAGKHAVTAAQLALDMAGLNPEAMGERFGLYASQAGQQHSDIDDYDAGFISCLASEASVLSNLWNGKDVNPFLAIKGLTNNLLGMISLYWSIRGDCSAFTRDYVGAAGALNEAIFNLRHGYIDAALVLTAGTVQDYFELKHENIDGNLKVDCGAVALVLQRQSLCQTEAIAEVFEMKSGYRFNGDELDGSSVSPEPLSLMPVPTFAQIMAEKYYCNPREPRWGGIIYSLLQVIHVAKQQAQTSSITVHSCDASGFEARVTVSVI